MSLLITSNSPQNINSGYNQQGINKSYSFQNNLNDTFKIPKNSEIAVQSVKINRSGNVDVNESNSIYAFYFGEELTGEDIIDGAGNVIENSKQRDVLSVPWSTSIGGDFELLNLANFGDVGAAKLDDSIVRNFTDNVNNIATSIKNTLNKSLWHPNLMRNASSGRNSGANVEALRNGSGLDWLGWKIQVTNTDSSKNASHISDNWKGAFYNGTGEGADYTFKRSSRVLESIADSNGDNNPVVGIDYPLSLANGSFHIKNFDKTANGRYGLCRALTDEEPDYYDGGGFTFYDFVVEIDDGTNGSAGDISVFYAGTSGNDELEMLELNYGTTKNASNDDITDIVFNVQNERVKIVIINGSGVSTTLCDGTGTTSASNVKPVSMTCRYLYPKIDMPVGKTCVIQDFFGVDIRNHQYLGFLANGNPLFHDFWISSINVGNTEQCKQIDCDFVKNLGRLNQLGLNSDGQCDYKVQFFLAPDSRYWNTAYCNSQFFLGFPNRSLVNTPNATAASSPFTLTYESDESPELKGTNSLFVRLKNMTFSSVNLAKGSNSKILYHVPAFSNTGSRTGALFFEPNERVYLKLNNTEDLYLSTIEVDMVYSDETLAEDLQGKTTVVFHIRDA